MPSIGGDSRPQIKAIMERFGWDIQKWITPSGSWNIHAIKRGQKKPREEILASVDREFNMVVCKSGRRLGRHQEARKVFEDVLPVQVDGSK